MKLFHFSIFFGLIYISIGFILAFRQKMSRSVSRQIDKNKRVDPDIYDADYYLHSYSRDEKRYLDEISNLSIKLANTFVCAGLKPGEKVLDLGCGRGQLAYHCVMNGCVVMAVDYSQDAIVLASKTKGMLPEKIRKKMIVQKKDFKNLDNNEKYDVIFMIDLVEHLYDWQLKELFEKSEELLKKDTGRIVIHTAPNKTWINIIFPLKRILNWPSVLRKKKDFFYRRDKYSYDEAMHVNEQTPRSLRQLLKRFKAKVWCNDGSSNIISLLTKRFAGADIWAVAKLKKDEG